MNSENPDFELEKPNNEAGRKYYDACLDFFSHYYDHNSDDPSNSDNSKRSRLLYGARLRNGSRTERIRQFRLSLR